MSLRLAVATEDFGTPLRRAIPQAAQAQVPGIQLNVRREILNEKMSASGLRQLGQYVRENRMQVSGLSCPTRHALADPEYLEERLQLIRSAMEVARPLDTASLMVPCGLIPNPDEDPTAQEATDNSDIEQLANPFSFATDNRSGRHDPNQADQFDTLRQVVNDLVRHGNHVGCILTLQLPNYDISLVGRLLAGINAGPVQISFDPAVAIFTGAQVVDTYRQLYQHIGHVRARDGRRNSDYSGMEAAIGDGVVPWDVFLPTLIEADFTDWVCIERTGGDHRPTDVLRGVAHTQSLLPQPTEG